MKRSITNIVDEQREKDKSSSPPPPYSPLSSPRSSPPPTTNGYPVLYVDVVKNRPTERILPTPPLPRSVSPEFSIFPEDFPALPRTANLPLDPNSTVPVDWKSALSEEERAELAKYRDEVMSSDTKVGSDSSDDFLANVQGQEKAMDSFPQFNSYLVNSSGFDVSLIFGKQFLQEGVRQRALIASRKRHNQESVYPPPGFENTKIFARMKTNGTGMPLGGVNFELGTPLYDRMWKMNSESPRSAVEGSFGMLGLASKLGSVQRNPRLMPNLFGDNVQYGGSCRVSFPGSNYNYNVPLSFRLAGRLGLPQPRTDQMQVELLFYLFYTFTGDLLQMLAAAELAERGWRYHKFMLYWIIRQADNPNYSYKGYQESGEYNYFNMCQWKIQPRHFQLDPEQIDRTLSKEELYKMHGYHPQMSSV
ncbi:uncharacterized protein LOC108098431 [Drosophila ficusphila]|uniref:uncharacterized protein LOC108098431 n=1 Tax=Drosophila ficusphila TaxID=30025 RepID=UPI0007E66BCA|nr:uncharacterized protein LOC108098431 [Drosophila ficusphila]